MSISKFVQKVNEEGSVFTDVFNLVDELVKKMGEKNVCNFAIGNPALPAPQQFRDAVVKIVSDTETNFKYGPFTGFPKVREKFAEVVSKQQGVELSPDNIIMTCGVTGGLNTVFKTFINLGENEEVIINAPYYPDYVDLAHLHGAIPIIVRANSELDIDIDAFEKAITPKTKIVIINSPNNPSGKIYPHSTLEKVATILKKQKQDIYLISDEPYREIAFGQEIPPIFQIYDNSFVLNSVSKDMSLAGIRIGWIAINPKIKNYKDVNDGLCFVNLILECEAPVIEQKAVAMSIEHKSELNIYKKRVLHLAKSLKEIGYQLHEPQGSFYLFPKTPIENDTKFCKEILSKYGIVCLPGTAFGYPGYMRISCCCDDDTIERSIMGFKKAFEEVK